MLIFPTHLFNPASMSIRIAGATVTGGESLSGESDTIRTDGGGYWIVTMSEIELLTPDLIRAWRAWEAMLDGGVTQVLVPALDVRQAPYSTPRPPLMASPSDDPYFPEIEGFSSAWMAAQITSAAALRATQVEIDMLTGQPLKGGEHFYVDHEGLIGPRMYRVRRVVSRPTAQKAVVQIRPPLRGEITSLPHNINFDWPMFVGTMLPEVETDPVIKNGHATVNIAFRESVAFGPGSLLLESSGPLALEGL